MTTGVTSNVIRLSDAQLTRAIYSLWDFQQGLSAMTFLREECDYSAKYTAVDLRRFRCFETSAIISLARPFEAGRGQAAIALKALGIALSAEDRELVKRVTLLRHKVVAHSDEEAMHYEGMTIEPFEERSIRLPHFRFRETLYLTEADAQSLELLLRKLLDGVARAVFQIAQVSPERVNVRKTPTAI